MSRSEREFEASRALNEWYIQPFMDSDFSRIEYIHTQMCEQWTSPYGRDNSDDWTADSSWQDFNSPPPWNPKLKDINMDWTQPEKLIEILNNSQTVFNTSDIFEDIRRYVANNAKQAPEQGKLYGTGDDGGDFFFFPIKFTFTSHKIYNVNFSYSIF